MTAKSTALLRPRPATVPRSMTSAVLAALITLVTTLGIGGPAVAQNVTFEQLVIARESTSLLLLGDRAFMGLDGGGLVIWPVTDPTAYQRLTAGDELTHNQVTDLVFTGEHLWVATAGGGLTRVTNPTSAPSFRQYTSNLGSLDLTAVTGGPVDDSERVFYGMAGAGIGRINDGLPGQIYTAQQDGLIDDDVNDLILLAGDLFAATPSGVSLFKANVFRDVNAGLDNLVVRTLAGNAAGDLFCGGDGGVYRWQPQSESWTSLGGIGVPVRTLATGTDGMWALGWADSGPAVLAWFDGAVWTTVDTPHAASRSLALADGDDQLWVGGRSRDSAMDPASGLAFLARRDGSTWSRWSVDATLVFGAHGLSFDSQGGLWTGARQGDAFSGYAGGPWQNVYQVATEANSWQGLFDHDKAMLAVTVDSTGAVWCSQYGAGLVRYHPGDPEGERFELITPQNSGLISAIQFRQLTHPDGSLVVLYDLADPNGVSVLVEPDHWSDESSWYHLPQGTTGLNGSIVPYALVERNDVIWFVVDEAGLVRWDINGDGAGPDDPITWQDPSDDRWDPPISTFDDSTLDPKGATSLALAADGSIWFGAGGVGRFSYDPGSRRTELLESYREQFFGGPPGLLSANVVDLAVDANGDLWVLSNVGLNRIQSRTIPVTIDAYIDLANYFSNPTYGALYSPNVIAPLPGGIYWQLAISPDGYRLATSSDGGTARMEVAPFVPSSTNPLVGLIVYPNPYHGAQQDGELKVGGIAADLDDDDPATVEILDLSGEVVYRNSYVSADVGFWDGRNRYGKPAVTGLYLVKVSYRGNTAVKTLAVVR